MSLDVYLSMEGEGVYWDNITHNLGNMASKANIYMPLWRPEEICATHAKHLITPLTEALADLRSDPEHYKQFNAENGWGLYEHFVPFVEKYLEACKAYPDAVVRVSR